MAIDSLRQLSAWLDEAGIDLMELRGPGTLLRLGPGADDTASVGGRKVAASKVSPHPEVAGVTGGTGVTVTASSAGVFLHTHPMQSTPLAPVDSSVAAGAPLGLLQIGALLLPVRAPRAGVVRDLRVAHGILVGYGTPLVELDADGPVTPSPKDIRWTST